MSVGNSQNLKFYSINFGKICRNVKQPTETSRTRVNQNGKTVHEEYYDFIDGLIRWLEITEHKEYGKFWKVTLEDAESGEMQILQFNHSSGFAQGFLKALPNIDLTQKVKIIPSQKKEGEKTKSTIFLNQHGKAAKWAFTKDNPNGLPELKQIKRKGKMEWDDSDIMEFLEAMVTESILPQLKKPAAANVQAPVQADESDNQDQNDTGTDATSKVKGKSNSKSPV